MKQKKVEVAENHALNYHSSTFHSTKLIARKKKINQLFERG